MTYLKSCIAGAIGLTIAAQAFGQTGRSDASAPRLRLADHLLSILDYKSYAARLSQLAGSAFPEGSACQSLWRQVVDGRLATSEPLFREVVVDVVPKTFTPSEIKTGISLFEGPVGELIRLGGQTPRPTISSTLISEADKQLRATPGANDFKNKVENPHAFPDNVAREFAGRFGPLASSDFSARLRATGLKCRPT